jgi:RND superfamily putative drug exporter
VERLTRTVLRLRWPILGTWLALAAASFFAMSGLSELLTNRFALPGTDTERAETILQDHFGQAPTGAFTLVAKGRPGGESQLVLPLRQAAERAASALRRVEPKTNARVAFVQPAGEGLASAVVVTELELADVKIYTDDVREATGAVPAAELLVSGPPAVEYDLDPVFAEDIKVGEFYIAVPIALVILVFVFGTLSFLVPFLVAAAAIPVSLGIVWIFANFMDLSTYLQNLVMLIGLGIAIDYSLLIVYRYREERAHRGSREDALMRTMATAGRAIIFSGSAVAIGLALMLFMPLPFMRGFGLGGLIIPLVSVLAGVTLLPILLFWLGHHLDRVRLVPKRLAQHRTGDERDEADFWVRLSHWVMRRPVIVAAATSSLLLALAAPVFAIELGPGSNKGIPQDLESVRALNLLADAVGEGALTPAEIVVDTGRPGGSGSLELRLALLRLIRELNADPEVAAVRFGDGPEYVDPTGRYLHLQTIGRHEYGLPESQAYAKRLRSRVIPAAGFPDGTTVVVGGAPAGGVDFLDKTYGAFPWLVLAVLVMTYLLLVRAFRSLLLPLKAIVMNLLSIGAAYGLLVTVFKWGLGEPFGIIGFDQIEGWIPVFLFAMLFGLSMDYEVFLVSRMREEWDACQADGRAEPARPSARRRRVGASDNEHAVASGLARTGRIVTAAGLVMFAAFMGFVAGSIVGLQEFGFGLAAAIIIDVTLVRALLVPSLMKLFGRWNWWLPGNVARVLRVRPSPLAPAALEPTRG